MTCVHVDRMATDARRLATWMETISDIGLVFFTEETLLISDRLCTTKRTCFHEEDIDCIEEEVEKAGRDHEPEDEFEGQAQARSLRPGTGWRRGVGLGLIGHDRPDYARCRDEKALRRRRWARRRSDRTEEQRLCFQALAPPPAVPSSSA